VGCALSVLCVSVRLFRYYSCNNSGRLKKKRFTSIANGSYSQKLSRESTKNTQFETLILVMWPQLALDKKKTIASSWQAVQL
jgi:hypothetical protein